MSKAKISNILVIGNAYNNGPCGGSVPTLDDFFDCIGMSPFMLSGVCALAKQPISITNRVRIDLIREEVLSLPIAMLNERR